jgi:hypothetical protein
LKFLQFSTDFTRIGKKGSLLHIQFYSEAPGTFLPLTNMPLVCGKDPGTK